LKICLGSDARLGALVSGGVSPGLSRFRLIEEEDAVEDMLMMRRSEWGLVLMALVGIESIRACYCMQQIIRQEHDVYMLQQRHHTTGTPPTSLIKFCPTIPLFLETEHEIQMGEAAPIESTYGAYSNIGKNESYDKRERKEKVSKRDPI
jgi:hypothetical protein